MENAQTSICITHLDYAVIAGVQQSYFSSGFFGFSFNVVQNNLLLDPADIPLCFPLTKNPLCYAPARTQFSCP